MSIASRSTNVRAKPKGLDQPNGDGAYDRGSNVARLGVDAGEQESLLAERREFGNTLGERKVESAWPGKATGGDTVNATISMCANFLVGTPSWFDLFASLMEFDLKDIFVILEIRVACKDGPAAS